ncbi:thiamine-monophosphate kinase [Nibricoccus sp. IMCC34717]|uniref:thiamine-phosphate kinase n=1 Tax=Nibricoccus sp. IMCC34717 TaxID=3034021 RepID=UPI00384FEE4E
MSPFAQRRSDSVASLGEVALIHAIRKWLGRACPPAPRGIGDDCAVLPASPKPLLVTVDPVVHGRHFDDSARGADVGAKLLLRNLSDIAAMGGTPLHATVSLLLPDMVSISWIHDFHRGLAREALRHGVAVVGGDVAGSPTLAASLTLLGRQAGARSLFRVGARAGDRIFVTGELGGSLLGRHLRFEPRLAEGRWLAGRPEVRAMMDISDGLAKDLGSLCPAGTEPALRPETVPISRAAKRLARTSGRTALEHALCDGEDYELVFAVDRRADLAELMRAWRRRFETPLTEIGAFFRQGRAPEGTVNPLTWRGYAHLG